jgi:pilus assembly protein Flp/PilA
MDKLLKLIVAVQMRIADASDKERGATATEYAMLIAFIVITLSLVMLAFGADVSAFFTAIGAKISGWSAGL